jgi:hypothetical protein
LSVAQWSDVEDMIRRAEAGLQMYPPLAQRLTLRRLRRSVEDSDPDPPGMLV